MSALIRVPHRDRLQAVLMKREGLGWRVGIGLLVAGRIEGEARAYMSEHDAEAAATSLADVHDLLAVRC